MHHVPHGVSHNQSHLPVIHPLLAAHNYIAKLSSNDYGSYFYLWKVKLKYEQ